MDKKHIVTYHLIAVLCLTAAVLTACSGDDAGDSTPAISRGVRLQTSARQFQVGDLQAGAPAQTRGTVTLPDANWSGYLQLYPETNPNMLLFVAKPTNNPSSSDVISRLFSFSALDHDWQANITINDTSPEYQLFGFLPIDAGHSSDNVSVGLLPSATNYMAGALMTVRGLKVLTDSDPCVIVGVAKAADKNADVTLTWGHFGYYFTSSTTADVTDYMYLLLDHIYSRYHFQLKVNADYDALRTFRVTKMTVEALDNSGTQTLGSVDAAVAVRSNTTNSNPLSSVTYRRNNGERVFTLYDKETQNSYGFTPNATQYKEIGSCLAPADQRWFQLTTWYEVLDGSGTVIRTDKAVNRFNIGVSLTKKILSTTPGMDHKIQILVNPTYLQMLSDYDLTNPAFTIN